MSSSLLHKLQFLLTLFSFLLGICHILRFDVLFWNKIYPLYVHYFALLYFVLLQKYIFVWCVVRLSWLYGIVTLYNFLVDHSLIEVNSTESCISINLSDLIFNGICCKISVYEFRAVFIFKVSMSRFDFFNYKGFVYFSICEM